jgi:ribosomal protein L16 Arg81 hydroxylase
LTPPITQPLALLGGISPQQFMQRYWQKKPLLVRGAVPGMKPLLDRAALFELAAQDEVESRLVVRSGSRWKMRRGPLPRRSLPPLAQRDWTLLVQGVDLHNDSAHRLLSQFRFVPDARLDDLMISWASDGGGVGPHFDSYDVFLLQAQGQRRWRIGRQKDLELQEGVPLKILANFEPQQEYLLEPGDMHKASARPIRSAFGRRPAANSHANCCSGWPRTPTRAPAWRCTGMPERRRSTARGRFRPNCRRSRATPSAPRWRSHWC